MRHKEVITLMKSTITADSIGNQIETWVETTIFANEYYIGQAEFYNASVKGLKPEKQFEIYTAEYNDAEKLKHNGIVFNIIRTEKRGDKTRLACERVGADG